MLQQLTIAVLVLLVCFSADLSLKATAAANPSPTQAYENSAILQAPDSIYLYWNCDNTTITFEVHYKAPAVWLLFGLSAPPSTAIAAPQPPSDVIVVWLNSDLTGHFSNRQLWPQGELPRSPLQTWTISQALAINNYTVITMSRVLRPCNGGVNVDIGVGATTVVFETGANASIISNNPAITLADFALASLQTKQIVLLNATAMPMNPACYSPPTMPAFNSTPMAQYSSFIDLQPNGQYRFYWNVTDTELIGEIHCRTLGWVGFGISQNGNMDGSDVIVGWIDRSGAVNFTDRHIVGTNVRIDEAQDWTLLGSKEDNGYTVFAFKRPLVLCANTGDLAIPQGTPPFVFAWGTTDPQLGGDISYHMGNRGTQNIQIIGSTSTKKSSLDNLEVLTFTIYDVILPYVSTYYYVQMFQVPTNLTQKRHVLAYEFKFPTINQAEFHHSLNYECAPSYKGTPAFEPGDSFTNNIVTFPETTGYPIGGDTDYSYFVVELHYNNPAQRLGYIESFSIIYYATTTLQPNELGILAIGTMSDFRGIVIPPRMSSFTLTTYCSSDCISAKLNGTDITVVMSFLHTHLAGVKVSTTQVRNNSQIGYVGNNVYYDFNFQKNMLLQPPVVIISGDKLITQCTYNTLNREGYTIEMCLNFLVYYPRIKTLKECWSIPYIGSWSTMINALNQSGDISVPKYNPYSFDSIWSTLSAALANVRVTRNIQQGFQALFDGGIFSEICGTEFFLGPFDPVTSDNTFEEPHPCLLNTNSTTQSRLPTTPPIIIATLSPPSPKPTPSPTPIRSSLAQLFVQLFNLLKTLLNVLFGV